MNSREDYEPIYSKLKTAALVALIPVLDTLMSKAADHTNYVKRGTGYLTDDRMKEAFESHLVYQRSLIRRRVEVERELVRRDVLPSNPRPTMYGDPSLTG